MVLRHDSKLIQNLLLKNELLRNGDKKHEGIRTALLILSGANLGAYGNGTTIALHLLGLADVFDVVVGVSTGAGIGDTISAEKIRRFSAHPSTTQNSPVPASSTTADRGRLSTSTS